MVKKILNFVLVALSVVGVFMTILYAYNSLTDKELYTSSTSTYASSVTDPQTGKKLPPFEINYYSNFNNTGKEVVEFNIRCYSDINRQALYCRGYQLVYEDKDKATLYYYDSFNGNSWESGHVYDETNEEGQQKTFYFVDIDDEIYAIRLDGSYTYPVYSINYGKLVANSITRAISLGFWKVNYVDTKYETHYYTYTELLEKMASIVKSASYGTGSYTMPLIDLGDYLHVYDVNEKGVVDDSPVGDGSLINSYFAIDVNYDKRGMTYAEQSIFNSVAGDADFNITGIDFNVNYWKTAQVYNLTEADFVERYSSVDGGYLYSLPNDKLNELKKYSDIEICINFDVSKIKNKNVVGFDNYALYGIKVSELKITNSKECNFKLLVGSLKETGLTKITTHNVTIQNYSGLEVDYEVV